VTEQGTPTGITRRQALKRGAAIAGVVWAAPAMQVLNMSAAHATDGQSGSETNASRVTSTRNGTSSEDKEDQ
jgi:hypothetical protein